MFKLQTNEWDPIIEWFNKRFNLHLEKSVQMDKPPVSEEDKSILTKHLMSYNFAAINGKMFSLLNLWICHFYCTSQ